MAFERIEGALAQGRVEPASLDGALGQQMSRERQNVVGSFGEGRNLELDDVESKQQILAKPCGGDLVAEIGVVRGEEVRRLAWQRLGVVRTGGEASDGSIRL